MFSSLCGWRGFSARTGFLVVRPRTALRWRERFLPRRCLTCRRRETCGNGWKWTTSSGGWASVRDIPSEATFSRAFAEFAGSSLPERLHEALVRRTLGDHLVGHISRDSTGTEAREKPARKPAKAPKPKARRGRPRKGEERPREPSLLERRQDMELCEMLDGLPKA